MPAAASWFRIVALFGVLMLALGSTSTRTGTPALQRLTMADEYRASSMNQNATSRPTCSLLIRVSSGVRQSSKAGSHRRSVAAAGLAAYQRQRAAAVSHEERVERGMRIRRSLLLSLNVTAR